MEKKSPQAVCGGVQIHKRLLFTPQTLSLQTKRLSLLPELEFLPTSFPTQRLANPNLSLSSVFLFFKEREKKEIVGGQG